MAEEEKRGAFSLFRRGDRAAGDAAQTFFGNLGRAAVRGSFDNPHDGKGPVDKVLKNPETVDVILKNSSLRGDFLHHPQRGFLKDINGDRINPDDGPFIMTGGDRNNHLQAYRITAERKNNPIGADRFEYNLEQGRAIGQNRWEFSSHANEPDAPSQSGERSGGGLFGGLFNGDDKKAINKGMSQCSGKDCEPGEQPRHDAPAKAFKSNPLLK